MKRRLLLLALPLLLAALVFGVKWRADHPTPTKRDLAFRTMLSQASEVKIASPSYSRQAISMKFQTLSKAEFAPFIEIFNIAPPMDEWKLRSSIGLEWTIELRGQSVKAGRNYPIQPVVVLAINSRNEARGYILMGESRKGGVKHQGSLHPVTVKRWLDLLLANPRIGPELRARMAQSIR